MNQCISTNRLSERITDDNSFEDKIIDEKKKKTVSE